MGLTLPLLLILIFHLVKGDIIVQSTSGPIRGKSVGNVNTFLGIPYAEPPVGQLRFAKPQPKIPWNQVYDAVNLPPKCVQIESFDVSKSSEDCLYLNVWAPTSKSENDPKTVMLFIHGGSFITGSSSMSIYNGANLAERGDVVVVTINYRVGAFGFFSGLNEDTPGSQGLYDQVLAIQWIKDNARCFGGDPDNIVLFGESAGAFSVSMHQISPLSKNLFKRAILQSGSSINPYYTEDNEKVREISTIYASALGCAQTGNNWLDNPSDTISCLRGLPAEKFLEVDMELIKNGSERLSPRIGNDFLPNNTIELFRKGLFKKSQVLMGITRDEGTMFLRNLAYNETSANDAIERYLISNDSDGDEKIVESYLEDIGELKSYMKVVAEALGDILITCGSIFQAEYQSWKEDPVYFYMFDYRSNNSLYPEWMGVPHFAEVQYVFGNPLFGTFTEEEEQLSRNVMDMWTTFAKTGNPRVPGNVQWPRYSYEDPKYFIIGKLDTIGTRPDNNRCERLRNRFRSDIDQSVIDSLKKN